MQSKHKSQPFLHTTHKSQYNCIIDTLDFIPNDNRGTFSPHQINDSALPDSSHPTNKPETGAPLIPQCVRIASRRYQVKIC